MKKIIFILVLILWVMPCVAENAEPKCQFKLNGFAIAPLEGQPSQEPYQVLMMFLPASDGFAPNVNVQIQPFSGTIKEYMEISRQQFQAGNLKIIDEVVSDVSVIWEYSGMMQGYQLQWYAKAIQGDHKVYLVTATALQSQWGAVAEQLKTCVLSFSGE